jgi:hypothetical protein
MKTNLFAPLNVEHNGVFCLVEMQLRVVHGALRVPARAAAVPARQTHVDSAVRVLRAETECTLVLVDGCRRIWRSQRARVLAARH